MENPLIDNEIRELLLRKKELDQEYRGIRATLDSKKKAVWDFMKILGQESQKANKVRASIVKESYSIKARAILTREELETLFRENDILPQFFHIGKRDSYLRLELVKE